MADKANKDKLLKSANTYLELGKLLKKKRTSWARNEVEKILNQSTSDAEKIIAIKKIDDAALIDQEIKKNRAKESKAHKESSAEIPTIHSEGLKKSNVIIYLLFHFRRINSFAKKSRALELHFPNLYFTLSKDVNTSLKTILSMIQELFEPLDYILKNSWRSLTKEEYNSIQAFYHWANEFYQLNMKKFDYPDLLLIEKEFLILIQTEDNKIKLTESIEKALLNTPYQAEGKKYLDYIEQIIEDDKMKPSFSQILQAYHISSLHRYITISDLILFEKPPLIKTNRFQVDDDLQNKIRQYLWQKELLLIEKEKELKLIDFIEQRIVKDYQNHDFEYLKNFAPKYYLDKNGKKEINNFHQDVQDLSYFSNELLKSYRDVFKNFTLNKVSLVSSDNKIIQERLTPYSLTDHFKKIEDTHRMIMDLMDHKSILKTNFKRYIDYVREGKHVDDMERSLFDILNDLSRIFYDIALKLFQNYNNEKELNKKTQEERLKLLQQKDIFEKTIPFARGRLNLNHFLSHITVTEAYIHLIEFSANFALLFENNDILTALSQKNNVLTEINLLKEDIERLK